MSKQSLAKKLIDPNNTETVILYNSKDEPVEFEQIFLYPYKNRYFVILRKLDQDEGLVFEVFPQDDNIQMIRDDIIIDLVFDKYEEMYSQQYKN